MLRIVFFGSSGDGSMVPLEAVSRAHRVIALVKPSRSQSWLRRTARSILWRTGMGTSAAMARWARIHDVPLLEATAGSDSELANELERLRPDVICVSAFPWLLGRDVLQTAGRAALNVHSSLLPRHRGANHPQTGMPTYIRLGPVTGDGAAWLGRAYEPFGNSGQARLNMEPRVSVEPSCSCVRAVERFNA